MNLRSPRLWLAVVSACTVVTMAVVDTERTSPGELSGVHQRQPELAGGTACAACHGGWFSGMTASCLECHEAIGAQIDEDRGLHGVLGPSFAERCASCHSEHNGAGFPLVGAQSFRAAGFADRDHFDHARIGFTMDGAHLELECAECHEHADDPVLADGDRRFLGLDRDCASCHEDVHEGAMTVACASCHGQTSFDELHSLDHERFLPLVGGHADVSCRECHAEGEPHSLEIVGAGGSRPPDRECADCHESPHGTDFEAAVARRAQLAPDAACVTCHTAEHTDFAEAEDEVTAEVHALTGFPLTAPHDRAACDDCHGPELGEVEARYPGRSAEACSVCHEDPHGGQFARSDFAGRACTACHEREHFDPPAFGLREHAATSFPLERSHAEVECADCHLREADSEPRIFHGTPSDCGVCHEDAHRGYFDARCDGLEAVEHGDCARCHDTGSFGDEPADGFDHALWTGFAAGGAHAQEACESCHRRTPEPDAGGRTFGRIADVFGEYTGCATCHEDPHGGAFEREGPADGAPGRTGCERCHVEVSFRVFPREFDHAGWTDFPLAGAHDDLDCSACHAPLANPGVGGRTRARAAGDACADCHEDPHGSQFEVQGGTDCARCHRSSAGFEELSFNHEWDARFRLGRAHADLACSACHVAATVGGREVVKYRPLPTECVDCHGLREATLLRRKGKGY